MINDKFKITLTIGGIEFKPVIDRKDEEIYRQAEKEINSLFDRYYKIYKFNNEQLLRAVALQFAINKIQSKKILEEFSKEIEDINLDLEEFLDEQ